MSVSEKQKELDRIKWEKSQRLGFDACGSFDFCKCCDKSLNNPCEMAHNKFYNIPSDHQIVVEIKNDEIVSVDTKKETKKIAKKSSKIVEKKTVAKKKVASAKETKKVTTKTPKKSATKTTTKKIAKSTTKKTTKK